VPVPPALLLPAQQPPTPSPAKLRRSSLPCINPRTSTQSPSPHRRYVAAGSDSVRTGCTRWTARAGRVFRARWNRVPSLDIASLSIAPARTGIELHLSFSSERGRGHATRRVAVCRRSAPLPHLAAHRRVPPSLGPHFQLSPVRSAYQPPASSTFLSERTSHQQPASSTLLSEETSTSHQPPANRTG
jgi:hypothetical protein